jgi:hypothetical protein
VLEVIVWPDLALPAHPPFPCRTSGGHVCRMHARRVRNVQDDRPSWHRYLHNSDTRSRQAVVLGPIGLASWKVIGSLGGGLPRAGARETIQLPPATRRGLNRSRVVPSPSWPNSLSPQQ